MYVALYRKYRPKLFKDVLSQDHITTTLKNEVKLKKIAHSYIFSGPKGTGKTTCAKIFSQAINCQDPKEGEPCYKCEICLGLKKGTILDVTELDGASNNSVSDVRILRDEANFVPTLCKYRIYIIDEVHMLSSSAFNALLKIMEEPPKYVVFILATTDILKVPQTVVSRCQRFDFNRIKIKDMKMKIEEIAKEEKIKISGKASEKIASISNGSMRDAISIFDRCCVLTSNITDDVLKNALGSLDEEYVLNLHKAIEKKDCFKVMKIVNDVYFLGKNLEEVVLNIVDFYREMLYYNMFKEKAKDFLEYSRYCEIFENIKCFDYKKTSFILQEILSHYEKMKNSFNQKLFLELLMFKICENVKYDEHDVKINEENENKEKEKINFKKPTEKDKNNVENKPSKNFNYDKSELEKFIEIAKKNNVEVEEE